MTRSRLLLLLALVSTVFYTLYSLRRRVYAWALRVPPAHYRTRTEKNIRFPMRDGITLMGDHHAPRKPGSYPTILIRSPYGRNWRGGMMGFLLSFYGRRFAERGYHVIIQDVRGRFDSEGLFVPFFPEKADGLDTIEWIKAQPWFNGKIGLWGQSYLGIVQWVIAHEAPEIRAMMPIVSASNMRDILYPDNAFHLGLALRWIGILYALDYYKRRTPQDTYKALRQGRLALLRPKGVHTLPLRDVDRAVTGQRVPFYQEWLSDQDQLMSRIENIVDVKQITAPVHMIGGWYDFFLRAMLNDYAMLRDKDQPVRLTIGPWAHFQDNNGMHIGVHKGLDWFEEHLQGGQPRHPDDPVQLYLMGAEEWRGFADWPPPATQKCLYLQPGHRLADKPSSLPVTSHFIYDPGYPTPALGGAEFSLFAGPKDNRPLESRRDVLVFTGPVLAHDLDVVGPVRLQLYVCSDRPYTDFFGRVCDVHPDGRSINICDGLFRVQPGEGELQPDGSLKIELDLWATAHRFKQGHRVRLQVSSGAHPRWARNLGTSEPIGVGITLRSAHQTIYHDEAHPSVLILPILDD